MTPGSNEQAQPQFQVPESISALADALKGMPGSKEILSELGQSAVEQGVITKVEAKAPTSEEVVDTNLTNNAAAPEGNTQAAASNEGQAAAAAADENEEVDDIVVDPILGDVTTKVKKTEIITSFDALKEFSKKEFGQEIGDLNSLQKFMNNSVKKWRTEAQKSTELQDQVQKYEGIFENMPPELLEGVKSFFAADPDWKSKIVNTSAIDYSKKVEDYNTRELVEHYFPGDFSEEDFTEEEKPKAILVAEKAAKDKFITDKKSREALSAKEVRDAQTRLELRKTSISSSFTSLKESFPNLDSSVEKQIKGIMESGDISSVFFNKDGSFKPSAAEGLLLALHGKKTIQNIALNAKKRGETEANEIILTRAADQIKPDKGSPSQEAGNEKVKKEIDALLGGLGKQRTY